MSTRTITTRRGRTCESPLGDQEARDELARLVKSKAITAPFGQSLAMKMLTGQDLSEEQTAWCHILVLEARAKQSAAVLELPRLVGLIELGRAAGLKSPTIRALWKANQLQIRHKSSGFFAGKAVITDGAKYPDTINFGTLTADGVELFRAAPTWLPAALKDLNADPEGMARAYGRVTSTCCFCARALSTPESLAMGYGPDCAEHYQLPWGDEKAATEADLFELERCGTFSPEVQAAISPEVRARMDADRKAAEGGS